MASISSSDGLYLLPMEFTRSEIKKARAGLIAARRHAKAALANNERKVWSLHDACLRLKRNAEAKYDATPHLRHRFFPAEE